MTGVADETTGVNFPEIIGIDEGQLRGHPARHSWHRAAKVYRFGANPRAGAAQNAAPAPVLAPGERCSGRPSALVRVAVGGEARIQSGDRRGTFARCHDPMRS